MLRMVVAVLLVAAVVAASSGAHATFPGSNGKIAFSTNRDGNHEIYAMDSDGSNQTNLTQFPGAGEDLPSWSPDGTKLTFVSSRTGNFEIFTMNADGSNQTNVTNHASFDADPVWCTNTRIVFASLRAGTLDVWAVNSDGTNPVNLTPFTGSTPDDLPDCSPDGLKVVYESFVGGGNGIDIITMNADGSNKQNIVSNSADDVHPSWSPDGSRILFERQGNVYAVDTDGSDETLVIGEASLESAPVWSPDGTKVVFTTNRHGAPELYTANTDGSNQTRLTNNMGISDDFADWQAASGVAVGGTTQLPDLALDASGGRLPISTVVLAALTAGGTWLALQRMLASRRWRE
jgi:Tol biopolymer transport system component